MVVKRLICDYCGREVSWYMQEPLECPYCNQELTDEDFCRAVRCTGDDCEHAWFDVESCADVNRA